IGLPGGLTGVMLIALGATACVAGSRFGEPIISAAQLALYAGLYALMLGGLLDQSPSGPTPIIWFDLLLSFVVAAAFAPAVLRRLRS
ncbi:MAG: hypothetical protein AAF589_07255, partial [Planctomycetota bacterium]